VLSRIVCYKRTKSRRLSCLPYPNGVITGSTVEQRVELAEKERREVEGWAKKFRI
jgi:hypothetical protein